MPATGKSPKQGPGAGVDALDTKILDILQIDGRASFREIGRRLGVSEGTVRVRYNRMQSDGVVTIAAITDPHQLGYRIMAFCLINVRVGYQQSVIDELHEWEEITYISSCTGRADLYVQLVCNDHDQLWSVLAIRFPKIEGIDQVETFQELKMHKVSYAYPVRFGISTA